MSQKVAVVIDNMGTWHETPDEERDQILKELAEDGLEPELVFYGNRPHDLPDTAEIDVLVIDYGALWQTDTSDWTRSLLTWADDHPSSAVLIWSSMTTDLVLGELRDRYEAATPDDEQEYGSAWTPPWPTNVRAMHSGSKFSARWGDGDSIDWLQGSSDWLRSWFGITRETALDKQIREAGPLVTPGYYTEEDPT